MDTLFIQAANIILMRPHNWESLALVLCRNMRPSNYTEIKPHSACKQACPDRLERAAKRHDMDFQGQSHLSLSLKQFATDALHGTDQ